MKNVIVFILLIAANFAYPRIAVKLTNGAQFYISKGMELNIQGSIVCDDDGTGIENDGTIRLKNSDNLDRSDFINNANPKALKGSGTMVFNGVSEQVIGGSSPTQFHNLVIENTSNMGVILDSDVYVGDSVQNSGQLILNKGVLSSGDAFQNQTIYVLNNKHDAVTVTKQTGIDHSSYVSTSLKRRFRQSGDTLEYIYPVGSFYSDVYSPVVYKFNKTDDLGLKNLTITPSNFELDYVTELPNVPTRDDQSSFYNKIYDELYFEVKHDGELKENSKYALYLNVEEFPEIKTNKYGIISRLEKSDPIAQEYLKSIAAKQAIMENTPNSLVVPTDVWYPMGDIDPEDSKYRDFNASKYTRRKNLSSISPAFALASINDLDGLTKIERLFSNQDKEKGLIVEGIEFIETPVELSIYNTDGNRVYSHKHYQEATGTDRFTGLANEGFQLNKDEPVPNGTYYVLLATQNKVFKKKYIHLQFTK